MIDSFFILYFLKVCNIVTEAEKEYRYGEKRYYLNKR